MAAWSRTINIKQFLSNGEDAEAIKSAADGIVKVLPADAPYERLIKAKQMADDDPETALLIFNSGLDLIYDWADAHRVWLA